MEIGGRRVAAMANDKAMANDVANAAMAARDHAEARTAELEQAIRALMAKVEA